MYVSLATLCTNMVFSCFLLASVALICYRPTSLGKLYIYAPILSIGIIAIRFLLPFEWSFTHTIPIGGPYASLASVLGLRLVDEATTRVTVWDVLVGVSLLVTVVKFVLMMMRQRRYARRLKALPTAFSIIGKTAWGTPCKVRCVVDDSQTIPLAFGLIHPTIVLSALPLSTEEHNLIVAHELAHIEYGDMWIKYFVEIVCMLYWWNPLMVLLRENMDIALETRVDKKVIRNLSKKEISIYQGCLLDMLERGQQEDTFFVAKFIDVRGMYLKNRFRVMNNKERSWTVSTVLVSIIMAIAIGTSFVVFEPYGLLKSTEPESAFSEWTESYLVVRDDGKYDLYMNGQWAAEISDASMLEGVVVYNNLEEVLK